MENPDWKESEAPPPPAFDFGKLQTFDVASNPTMVYGVDPASISISKSDSVVRYVMVATSSGGVRNVMYEALHCSTGEVKTYARYLPEGRWQPIANPQWRSVFDKTPSMHALAFARQGACDARAPASSVREIVSKLKNTGRYLDQ
jgi:CNP1-like family